MLRARDAVAFRKCKDFLNLRLIELGFMRFHFRFDSDEQEDALKGVFVLGPVAKACIPEIHRMLQDGLRTKQAIYALGRTGPMPCPCLWED